MCNVSDDLSFRKSIKIENIFGDKTLSIMTIRMTTLSTTTISTAPLSITTFRIMTLG